MKVVPSFVSLPFTSDLTLDRRVLLFSVAVSLLTAIIFGLAPGLRATQCDLFESLRVRIPIGDGTGRFPLRTCW